MDSNRIEKRVFLRAPHARVWEAVADSREFGSWFGLKLEGAFTPGAHLRGVVVPTTADPETARQQKVYEGAPIELVVDRVEPEHLFSFRWHPFAVVPGHDYSTEPMTLVTFTLEPEPDGVLLTVAETGFEGIPLARRAEALKANDGGWAKQTELVAKHLAQPEP